jgi:hypothetical protein
VQEFLDALQAAAAIQDRFSGNDGYSYIDRPDYKAAKQQVDEQLPLIKKIASVADPGLCEPLEHRLAGGSYSSAITASYQLIGTLKSAKEANEILGDKGPKMAADDMHRWVWEEAAHRWSAGLFRDAVQSAATRIFDVELPHKLGTQPSRNPADLLAAFATDKPAGPQLRFEDINPSDPSWASVHRGVMLFGQGCVMAIRNPRTHRLDVNEEQAALEELAAISLLARWIDDAVLQLEPHS